VTDIITRLKKINGHIGFYYKNLYTEEVLSLNADDTFFAASVIKLPIYADILRRASKGEIDLCERITVRNEEKVPSCGALNSFTDEPSVDIRTLCRLMITLSDNTATNVLIKRIGMDTLNEDFVKMCLIKTHIYRLLFDAEAGARGLENLFSPIEIASLLEAMERGKLNGPAADQEMKETLLKQQINHKIPGYIRGLVEIAHKTGEDSHITNDVGIVYTEKPFILIFAANEVNVPEMEQEIRSISKELYLQNSKA
jgi:beta-lactamase class A